MPTIFLYLADRNLFFLQFSTLFTTAHHRTCGTRYPPPIMPYSPCDLRCEIIVLDVAPLRLRHINFRNLLLRDQVSPWRIVHDYKIFLRVRCSGMPQFWLAFRVNALSSDSQSEAHHAAVAFNDRDNSPSIEDGVPYRQ